MTKRPNLTGGLTPDQASMVEKILEQVGFIGNRKSFCKDYDITPIRLNSFLRTSRARAAAKKATDYSRTLYFNHLQNKDLPEECDLPLHCMAQAPKEQWELDEAGLQVRRFGRSAKKGGEQDRDSLDNDKQDLKDSIKFIQSQDPTMTKEEIKRWNRLANGKK